MSAEQQGRTESGRLTEEFLRRLEQNREELPGLLVELASTHKKRIVDISEPTKKDVEDLLGDLREQLGGAEAGRKKLVETCGHEGAFCGLCPFGAFIPPEMGFSSLKQPICLPFISVTREDLNL